MWVFDGEEWVKEGGSGTTPKAETPMTRPEDEGMVPELQIVEIPLIRHDRDPYMPFPIP